MNFSIPNKLAESVSSGKYLDPAVVRSFRSLVNGHDPYTIINAALELNPDLEVKKFHAAILGLDTYPLVWLQDIEKRIDQRTLIRGVIKPSSMVVCYGESNSGKSFHALDRDLCLATGRKWFKRETEPGLVLYIAAEGAHSIQNRVAAYRDEYLQNECDIPFAIIPSSINLLNPESDTQPLIEFVKRLQGAKGQPCIKMTIDTLSRAMAGGNENDSQDMGRLVFHADKIREEIGCCLEFIHHSGKDASRGARGHSILRAATDSEVEITNNDGLHVARVTKQRDLEVGDEFAFKLRQVIIGQDAYGHSITTCVPEWILDHDPTPIKSNVTPQKKQALAVLEGLYQERKNNLLQGGYDGDKAAVLLTDWYEKLQSLNVITEHRNARYKVKKELQDAGLIHVDKPYVYPIENTGILS
ncbi:MAG: AAA family ATPase [Candidatus Thiodiazotropha endolucinida]